MANMRKDEKQEGVYYFDETEEERSKRNKEDKTKKALAEMQEFLKKQFPAFNPKHDINMQQD